MRFDADIYIQVARRAVSNRFAMFAQADRGTVINTSRYFKSYLAILVLRSLTIANRTEFFRDFTAPFTIRAD